LTRAKLPFKSAAIYILVATLVISGGATLGFLYFSHIKEMQRQDPAFRLENIDQKALLPSLYLEELLEVSVDKPVNLHELNLSDAEIKLRASPLIKDVEISKVFPNGCQISYTVNDPVARLSDWPNGALDKEGRLIPICSFFDAELLPIVTIGEFQEVQWGKKIRSDRIQLALELVNLLPMNDIKRIDVSRVEQPSFGLRELVIVLEKEIVRLNPDHWQQGWMNFQQMQKILPANEQVVVDLRIQDLAYIDEK